MSRVSMTVITTNTFAPAYDYMLGLVCPKTVQGLVGDADNYALGLDFAENKEHKAQSGRLRC